MDDEGGSLEEGVGAHGIVTLEEQADDADKSTQLIQVRDASVARVKGDCLEHAGGLEPVFGLLEEDREVLPQR